MKAYYTESSRLIIEFTKPEIYFISQSTWGDDNVFFAWTNRKDIFDDMTVAVFTVKPKWT